MPLAHLQSLPLAFPVRLAGVCILFCCHQLAPAQEAPAPDWWDKIKAGTVDIAKQGKWDLYLSGYARHSRSTYTSSRLKKLNEELWGGGFGKTLRDERGNESSLYALVIRDSKKELQWSAGYAYQWIYVIPQSRVEFGAGLTAGMIRRPDWYGGAPFPAILPLASFGLPGAKLMATYVPRISTRKGKGNVLFLFARFEFQ